MATLVFTSDSSKLTEKNNNCYFWSDTANKVPKNIIDGIVGLEKKTSHASKRSLSNLAIPSNNNNKGETEGATHFNKDDPDVRKIIS